MYKVLLVDDEYMILVGLQKLIDWESLGMEIAGTARNGKKALDFIAEHPVDIILTDVTMPVLSGIDFIREAQKIAEPFKFIILSGYQEFEYVKSGMHLGASNYLLKPIDKEELYHSLENILKEFEQAKLYNQADQVIFEGMLGRWIRNELQEDQLGRLFENASFDISENTKFTVVLVRNKQLKDWELSFKEVCRSLNQPLFLSLNEKEKVIILTEKENIELQLNKLNEKMGNNCLFYVGSQVENTKKVYKSYKTALKAKKHADFYGQPFTLNTYKENKITDLTLSGLITDLNEGIFSKNIERISKEISLFIRQLKENQLLEAENVKRLMYLVIVNVYLQFDAIE
ncbi:response regulator, partial [Carnobacterium sp.]|uniref:response regulator n=1 Tax=Carnobacterium sp. TaxID=48221 RepID=UPI0028AC043E